MKQYREQFLTDRAKKIRSRTEPCSSNCRVELNTGGEHRFIFRTEEKSVPFDHVKQPVNHYIALVRNNSFVAHIDQRTLEYYEGSMLHHLVVFEEELIDVEEQFIPDRAKTIAEQEEFGSSEYTVEEWVSMVSNSSNSDNRNTNTNTDTNTMSDRALPEDQVQMDDADANEDAELQPMDRAENLSRHYEEVKQRTVEDGVVLGKLEDINTARGNNRIVVDIDLPAEDSNKQFRFRDPAYWTDDFEFVRWVRSYGYTDESFPLMLEDDCEVKVEKGNKSAGEKYELVIPDADPEPISSQIKKTPGRIRDWHEDSSLWASHIYGLTWVGFVVSLPTRVITLPTTEMQAFGVSALGFIVLCFILLVEIPFKSDES
jgi:hypothetical protein